MSSHQGLVSCLLVSVLLFPILCSALDRNSFPHGFQFGFSTSAFQVEGAAHEDGRGPSIWDTFCSIPGKILGGGNGEVAADVYHRYKEDVQILKNLGTDLYRFSISWPRIFPGGSARNGGVNSKGVQYYHNLINELIENGIEPCATIFHWDVPQVLEDEYGGFRSKRILDDYSEFAEFCFKEFGDRVKMWVTINEPSIFATHGYGNGINAPGRCSPPACPAGDSSREPYLVSHVLLLAHSRAVRIYRSKYQESQKGRIGIAVHSDWYMPLSSSEEDVDATERVLDNTLGLFLDPLVFGDYPKSVKKLVGSRLPKFTEEESIGIKASFDFIGMNHYVTLYVMDNSTAILSPPADGPSQDEPDSPEVPDTFSITTSEKDGIVIGPSEMKDQGVTENRLQLLRGVTGAFRPGVLTALMGVSGAGKTTLMDVLAGRKTGGYIEGDIRISGFPKNQATFARISGYCEQNDIHSPQVTVRESLIYSAFLRLPKEVIDEEKMIFADEVMELVELASLKDAIVGLPGITGLSTEQRKRLTIAVELVANPSIIFMDEPTSGLDARAAAIVMRTVRNTVDTGRTVVCTIHQPSIDIFEAFDELLLMKRGGQVIYSGPLGRNSHKVVEYFEAIPGVPKIKEKYNPATWMLEASSVAAEVRLGMDFAEYYQSSPLHQRNKALVKELSIPPPGAKDLYFPTQYSQSTLGQFKSCLWKQWITYWRSPDYNLVRYFFTLVASLLLGTIFWKVGTKRDSANDLTIIIGAMYASVLFVGINNCSTVQPVVAIERTVFYRERAAGMYSALPYAIAQVIMEIPYVFIQTTYYTLVVYAMVSFQWTLAKFFWFFFVTFFTFLYFTYYGMMTVSITPNHQVAAIFAAAFYSLFNLFSGFFIPRPKIPKWWVWYYWICPVAWTVYGLIVSQYGDLKDEIQVPGAHNQTIKFYVEDHFGYDNNFMGAVAAVLVGFTIFFAFMFAYCIKVLNFQQR